MQLPLALLFGSAATVVGAATIFAWRMRESRRPVTTASIVIPPLAMSTGFGMFLVPDMRIPISWAVLGFLSGALLLAWPLVATTRLERAGDRILLQRSRAFIFIPIGLALLRFALRSYIDHVISPLQTAALFFLIAFGMIVRWRLTMLRDYRRLRARA